MDSLTQLALGSAVAVAVAGPAIGPRRAALVGAVLGTVPDLDVFIPLGDPVNDFVLHRGATHSLLVQAAVTPVFAEALRWMFSELRDGRWRAYALVYLCFATHALIDAVTVYGTRIFWPVWPDPVGLGSLFIIDPLYTLPLLVLLVWALFQGGWSPRFAKVTTWCLALSTGYMAWSAAAQQVAVARAEAALERSGIEAERVIATPTPFNTLFWRVIAVSGGSYTNVYVPLLGDAETVTAYRHDRGGALLGCVDAIDKAQVLAAFSDGFFKAETIDDNLVISDLRMGLTPGYVFSFAVAEQDGDRWAPIVPERRSNPRGGDGDVDWLLAGIGGEAAVRGVEAQAQIALGPPIRVAAPTAHSSSTCSPG